MTDFIVVTLSAVGSQLLWFGSQTVQLAGEYFGDLRLTYSAVTVVVILAWMIILSAFGTRDHRVVGSGTLEYKRVADATIRLFGIFALVAFLFAISLARGYFLTALPIGLLLLVASRWGWRQWLRRRQSNGAFLSRVLLVGERRKSEHVARQIRRATGSGMRMVGALTHDGNSVTALDSDVPVLGSFSDLLEVVVSAEADTVILTGADDISPPDMRKLGWDLEALQVELIVTAALTDIAGPRIHARPVAGLPLVHVAFPAFEGVKRFSKRMFDVAGSALLIVLCSPILIIVAIAVKTGSPGDLVYRQERIGRHGVPFGMLKFRSMASNADDQLESLLDAQGTSDKPLFKVMNDPRITPVGRVIRKYSLDEFPQLFNVLRGTMSLVGPRPQRSIEVDLYDDAAHRRLIMKPGMSGLWQVSGRSRLNWEDAIRLDLYYVENWSMTGDIIFLWRTLRAITTAEGAY